LSKAGCDETGQGRSLAAPLQSDVKARSHLPAKWNRANALNELK